jgi:6-hydroxycyclohex-1-ene-1-carbonyl-CoA dehydrogenase
MKAEGWFLVAPGKPLERRELTLAPPRADEAIVEVEACGLCHTDLGYADGSVAPRHALPLVLGHEIVGKVVAAGVSAEHLVGRRVIVPAVLPCGDDECPFCAAGRGNACPAQKMPGNDVDGGFATHVLVPAAPLVRIDDAPRTVERAHLAVVADAVSTAYQALCRARLGNGDAVFVVGAGGVGGYAIQLARAMGARVVACDVDAEKLALVGRHGASRMVLVADCTPKEVRKQVHGIAREWDIPSLRFRILECSGTPAGQLVAFGLLAQGATMVQVGYTPKPVELRLSNVMAFDATIHGSWGCPPALYPEVLRRIYSGQIVLAPFVERAPMSRVNEALDDMAHHRLSKRLVLDPSA